MDNNTTPPPSEPVHVPTPHEVAAHDTYVNEILAATAKRLTTLLQMTVMQTGHGDYVIWLMLYALNAGIDDLTYDADAAGAPLPAAVQIENKIKIDILAAIALERFAGRLRDRAKTCADFLLNMPAAVAVPPVEWSPRDQGICYDDALEQVAELMPAPDAGGEHDVVNDAIREHITGDAE